MKVRDDITSYANSRGNHLIFMSNSTAYNASIFFTFHLDDFTSSYCSIFPDFFIFFY